MRDPVRPVLHRAVREAQLGGHDTAAVLDQITRGSMDRARSIASVLHGRLHQTCALPSSSHPCALGRAATRSPHRRPGAAGRPDDGRPHPGHRRAAGRPARTAGWSTGSACRRSSPDACATTGSAAPGGQGSTGRPTASPTRTWHSGRGPTATRNCRPHGIRPHGSLRSATRSTMCAAHRKPNSREPCASTPGRQRPRRRTCPGSLTTIASKPQGCSGKPSRPRQTATCSLPAIPAPRPPRRPGRRTG